MTVYDGRDLRGRTYVLDHRVSWSDVGAGLLLTLLLAVSAVLVVVLFSDGSSAPASPNRQSAKAVHRLSGVQDPRRPGWRATNRPWYPAGSHETTPEHEDDVEAHGGGKL